MAEATRLPEREARYIRAGEAYIDRRYGKAESLYREILVQFPYETEARYSRFGCQETASRRLDPEVGESIGILRFISPQGACLHHMIRWGVSPPSRVGRTLMSSNESSPGRSSGR